MDFLIAGVCVVFIVLNVTTKRVCVCVCVDTRCSSVLLGVLAQGVREVERKAQTAPEPAERDSRRRLDDAFKHNIYFSQRGGGGRGGGGRRT